MAGVFELSEIQAKIAELEREEAERHAKIDILLAKLSADPYELRNLDECCSELRQTIHPSYFEHKYQNTDKAFGVSYAYLDPNEKENHLLTVTDNANSYNRLMESTLLQILETEIQIWEDFKKGKLEIQVINKETGEVTVLERNEIKISDEEQELLDDARRLAEEDEEYQQSVINTEEILNEIPPLCSLADVD